MILEESFGIVPLSQESGTWKIFLILHKAGRHWSFPKGHSTPGENPLDTAKRELQEETGLTLVSLVREIPFIENYQFKRRGKLISKRVSYFPAIVEGVPKLQPEEIREGRWFDLKTALQVLSFPEARAICQEVMKILNLV
ncbi:MAG: bis(5'-nucleosyl)-tetraphosphatase [Chlamydiales bacterium]